MDHEDRGPFLKCGLLEPFQNVTVDLTGCGGAFTPFSALDSTKTATLATELALDSLVKRNPSAYRYWVGDDRLAKDADLRTSTWYRTAMNGALLRNIETGFWRGGCPVCGDASNGAVISTRRWPKIDCCH